MAKEKKTKVDDTPTTPYTDVPVIHLTEDDLDDFQGFVKRILPFAMKVGAVKLVPPDSWVPIERKATTSNPTRPNDIKDDQKPNNKNNEESLTNRNEQLEMIQPRHNIPRLEDYKALYDFDNYQLQTPVKQWVAVKTSGAYSLTLMEQPSMTLSDYEKEANAYEDREKYKRLKKGEATVQEVERLFWKSMKFNPPLYGADHYDTFFTKGLPWNLNELQTIINKLGYEIPGVTRAYMYFGMWKSMFAWHVEDQNLFSISYNHFGAPKRWYVLPPKQRHQFDRYCASIYPGEFMRCHQFLQHKNYMLSPKKLKEHGFDVHTVLQRHGEFVMTMPAAYHGGFNYGFNCAEAVNFGIEEWMPLGKEYVRCQCSSDRANVDMEKLDKIISQKEEEEEEEEENTLNVRRENDVNTLSVRRENDVNTLDVRREEQINVLVPRRDGKAIHVKRPRSRNSSLDQVQPSKKKRYDKVNTLTIRRVAS